MEKKRKNKQALKQQELLSHMMRDPDTNDVLGSYTGTARDGSEPDQDADDL